MSGYRRENLNNAVMLFVVLLALKVNIILPGIHSVPWFIPVSLFTATGVYVALIKSLFWVISKSDFLMRLYWGKLYLDGYWSYIYSREGKQYYGIWRFEQDLDNIRVVGGGLNENFLPRTIVRSVSPLIADAGAYFVLNKRQELDRQTGFITSVYSKTTLILDAPKGFKPVVTIRATTEIYGGASSGHLHPDVIFRKHVNATSDEEVIEELKLAIQDNDKFILPDESSEINTEYSDGSGMKPQQVAITDPKSSTD